MSSSLRKVLLVDDDALVRGVIVELLTGLGFQVVEAQNGTEALERVPDHPDLDLLVTDILMPGMDGWTLAEKLRAVRPRISVLYVTGFYADDARPVEGGRVMRKPFAARDLARSLVGLI